VTDDDPDNTPRTYLEGEQHHSGAYRGLDPMQVELLKRLDRTDRLEHTVGLMDRDVASLTASRRFWGWAAGLGIPALLGAAFSVLLWSADRVSASAERVGRSEARLDALGKLIDMLAGEVAELRRHAGLPTRGTVAVTGP